MKSRILKLFFLVYIVSLAPLLWGAYSESPWSDYDEYFKAYHDEFLSWHDPDWRWLWAQGVAESNLDPTAVSHAGAVGLMQFMPGTFKDCLRALGIRAPRTNARVSIKCAAHYMRRLLLDWSYSRPRDQRWAWAHGSYNWGHANMLRAQRDAHGSTDINDLTLPSETYNYIKRIARTHVKRPIN